MASYCMFEAECVVGRVPEIENSRTRGIEIIGGKRRRYPDSPQWPFHSRLLSSLDGHESLGSVKLLQIARS